MKHSTFTHLYTGNDRLITIDNFITFSLLFFLLISFSPLIKTMVKWLTDEQQCVVDRSHICMIPSLPQIFDPL